MKVATISTLWDYIHRAMPWNAPEVAEPDEVYAVTAFLLNLGGVLPDDYMLSDRNIAEVQKLLPNRNGMTTDHGLWPGKSLGNGGKPDVKAVACMKDCVTEPSVASFLPDFARNAHGNLAEQNRVRRRPASAPTRRGPPARPPADRSCAAAAAARPHAARHAGYAAVTKTRSTTCLTCHGIDNKVVGPALQRGREEVRRARRRRRLPGRARSWPAATGVWGPIPMPPQTLPESDAKALAKWLAEGAEDADARTRWVLHRSGYAPVGMSGGRIR